MADTYTSNLNLKKPGYDSPADIADINANMDVIDSAVYQIANSNYHQDLRLDALEAANRYTLPTASTSVLGGVKVGSGLTIDANGVLSLNVSNASGVGF